MRNRTIVSLLLCTACAPGGDASEAARPQEVRTMIEATNAKLERWYASAQIDSVMVAYAPDAAVMGPNSPAAVGRDAIRTMWTGLVAAGVPHFSLKTQAVYLADSLAVEHGRYTLQLRGKAPADTALVLANDRGNYLVTWVRRGGQWLILYDIATSEVPLPAPPSKK